MENEEREQKRAEFEGTLTDLSDDDKTAKLTEWDTQNPLKEKQNDDEYRGKLNAQNRFLEKEGYEFKDGKWQKKATPAAATPAPEGLTTADAMAIVRSGISEEDEERVIKWAKGNGQSIAEALKDSDLRLVLDARAEERRTAAATNTGGARGTTKVSGADLLATAERTGELPETDEGMAALAEARFNRQRKAK